MFFVEQLVLPLAGRISRLGVNRAVDQGDQISRGEAAGDVWDAEVGYRKTALRVVAGQTPDDRAAPVVADPMARSRPRWASKSSMS